MDVGGTDHSGEGRASSKALTSLGGARGQCGPHCENRGGAVRKAIGLGTGPD